jgi:hypothetical protein
MNEENKHTTGNKPMKTYPTFTDIEVIKDNIRLVWEDIGEGWSGDYNDEDPDDTPLLRFSIDWRENANSDWEGLNDASYCTGLPIDTDTDTLCEYAESIIASLSSTKEKPTGYKRTLERWSWLGIEDLNLPQKGN